MLDLAFESSQDQVLLSCEMSFEIGHGGSKE
jgi:hypothetical protein